MAALTDQQLIEYVQSVIDDELDLDDPSEPIAVLMQLDDLHFNEDLDVVSDLTYDAFRLIIKTAFPNEAYFATVGSQVRGGKIDLPHQLGSLNQVEVGGLDDWKLKILRALRAAGITTNKIPFVVTAKLDGASALGRFAEGLKIAYSRGNGIQGADITRHVQHFVPAANGLNGWVRGENIIAKQTFVEEVQPNFLRSGGEPYKNPRNAVSGMMNASAHKDPAVYKHIDFVAYEVLGRTDINKTDMLLELNQHGFKTPQFWTCDHSTLNEQFLANCIQELRDVYGYEVDGVVVDLDLAEHREALNDGSLNPEYAFKYKTLDTSNYAETEVENVEWRVSFRGYLKPRINYKPCSLPGITSTYATGYNAKFILENGIGPGAIVGVSRMGEVVPNVIRVVQKVEPQMPPTGIWSWNTTGVDAVANDPDSLPEVFIKQLIHACDKLHMNFPHLGAGAIRKLVEHTGASSFEDAMTLILSLEEDQWEEIIGANGKKIYAGVAKNFHEMPIATFVGSIPFFGRGIGIRKMKKIFAVCDNLMGFKLLEISDVEKLESFDTISAEKIASGIDRFFAFYDALPFKPKFKASAIVGSAVQGLSICGTGFRDKAFDGWIEANGGKVASGVSGNTNILVAADPKSNSGKVKKANELNASGKGNVTIMSLQEFNTKYGR